MINNFLNKQDDSDKDYYSLYIKYKKKYLDLKNKKQIGAALFNDAVAEYVDSSNNQVQVQEPEQMQEPESKSIQESSQGPNYALNEGLETLNIDKRIINLINRINQSPVNYWKEAINNTGETKPIEDPIYNGLYLNDDYKKVNSTEISELFPFIERIYDYIQPNLENNTQIIKLIVSPESEVAYLGDYHSSIHSLIDGLLNLKDRGFFKGNTWELKDNKYLVFTGDLVDRGPYGIECMSLIYLLFILNNKDGYRVVILNGNHEEEDVFSHYQLQLELNSQLNDMVKARFIRLINRLPIALFLKSDTEDSSWYQFCHGGIDKKTQIDTNIILNYLNSSEILPLDLNKKLTSDDPGYGFIWGDFTNSNQPSKWIEERKVGWQWKILPSLRPLCSKKELNTVLEKHNIKSVISGHQDLENLGLVLSETHNPNLYAEPIERTYTENYYISKNGQKGTPLKTLKSLMDSYNDVVNGPNPGEVNIPMNQIKALTISSATISRNLTFSIYGILNLSDDSSTFVFFPSCNTDYLLFGKQEPAICNQPRPVIQ